MNSKELGKLGERIAVFYLQKKGYRIKERNYVSQLVSGPRRGEIDLVAEKNDIISFIEVKTQKNGGLSSVFLGEDRVDWRKQKKLIKTAKEWLTQNKISPESRWQIDIVAIRVNPGRDVAGIRHFKNVVSDF